MRNRLWNRVRAFFGGYFWLPCPICGKNFGGHEIGDGTLMTDPGGGLSVCRDCSEEATRRSQRFLSVHRHTIAREPLVVTIDGRVID